MAYSGAPKVRDPRLNAGGILAAMGLILAQNDSPHVRSLAPYDETHCRHLPGIALAEMRNGDVEGEVSVFPSYKVAQSQTEGHHELGGLDHSMVSAAITDNTG